MKTYNELLIELQLAPYSEEFMNIQKDCQELELLESYIDNKLYLRENINISHISEKTDNILKNIWESIFNFFMRIIRMIQDGLNSLINYLDRKFNPSTIERVVAEGERVLKVNLDAGLNVGKNLIRKGKELLDESTLFESENHFIEKFSNAYKEAKQKFDSITLQGSTSIIRGAFASKNIIITSKNKGDISEFFSNSDKNYVKLLFDIIGDNLSSITFEINNNFALNNFKIISVNDFINMMKFLSSKSISNEIVKAFSLANNNQSVSSNQICITTFVIYLASKLYPKINTKNKSNILVKIDHKESLINMTKILSSYKTYINSEIQKVNLNIKKIKFDNKQSSESLERKLTNLLKVNSVKYIITGNRINNPEINNVYKQFSIVSSNLITLANISVKIKTILIGLLSSLT